MARNDDPIKPLLAMLVLMGGILISSATLGYYRNTAFDLMLLGGFVVLIVYGVLALLLAGIVWGTAYAVVGTQNRATFRIIWVYTSCILLLIFALLVTHNLYQMGIQFRDPFPKMYLMIAPYGAIYWALSVFHAQEESDIARVQRLEGLMLAEAQMNMLRPAARHSDAICMVIGLALGGIAGVVYYIETHNMFTACLIFLLGGSLFGFAIAMLTPAQRQHMKAEKLRDRLRG
jgi:hypothetical protein